jgi:ribosomal protein S1
MALTEHLNVGDSVIGEVRAIGPPGIFVDIGLPLTAFIDRLFLSDDRKERIPEKTSYKRGDSISATVVGIDDVGHRIALSICESDKDRKERWNDLRHRNGSIIGQELTGVVRSLHGDRQAWIYLHIGYSTSVSIPDDLILKEGQETRIICRGFDDRHMEIVGELVPDSALH